MIIRKYCLLFLHEILLKIICCDPSSEPSCICCDPSSEPSRRDGSDEGSQHMVSVRNKKNYPSIIIK